MDVDGDVANSVIVSGSGNTIFVNAADFVRMPDARSRLRMLAVLAAPIANERGDGPPQGKVLNVWGEWERLRNATNRARDHVENKGAPWAVVRLVPPTADMLRDTLTPHNPGYQVVHISCHGSPEGLMLENTFGYERHIPKAALVDALRGNEPRSAVRLVVLNACETAEIGQALVDEAGVACVIATRDAIEDAEAGVFTKRLYERLAAGAAVGVAFADAQRALAEAIEAGELRVHGDAQARARNLVLLGDGDVRLEVNGEPATEPRFVFYPTSYGGNVPLPMTDLDNFVGRRDELRTLAQWFDQTGKRAFVLNGVGGIGKTALALNAAFRHAHTFRALAFASAKSIPDFGPQQVLQALNAALDLRIEPGEDDDLLGAITRRLNQHAVLLVLDNLESVPAEVAAQLAAALGGVEQAGGSRVLMTLRPQDKAPLTALVGNDQRMLHGLDPASAIRLLWAYVSDVWDERYRADALATPLHHANAPLLDPNELATLARLPAELTQAEVRALDDLARLAFRHPALINLAAAMLRNHGWQGTHTRLVEQYGKEIEDALAVLIGQMVDDVVQREPACLDVLRAMLVFAGGAAEEHLRAVVQGPQVQQAPDDVRAAIDFKDRLVLPVVQATLLVRSGNRYDLEAPVRAYLWQRYGGDAVKITTLAYRHALVHLQVVVDYDKALKEGRMTYSAPLEWNNVTAIWDWLAQGAPINDRMAQLLLVYANYWREVLVANFDLRRTQWLEAAVSAAHRLKDVRSEADGRQAMGSVQHLQGNTDAALVHYTDTLHLYQATGNRVGEANVLQALGDVQRFRKDLDAALASYEQALELYRQVGDYLGEANTLQAIGDVQRLRDEYDAALASYAQALSLYRQVGSGLGKANTLQSVGDVQQFRGEYDAALASYAEALGLYQQVGERLGEANTLSAQGQVALLQNDQIKADRLLAQSVALFQAVDSRYSIPAQIGNYGWTLLRAERHDQARPYLLRAADLFDAIGPEWREHAERARQAAEEQLAPPDMAEVLREFEPLLQNIAAVAQGDDTQRAEIEAYLPQLKEQGWQLDEVVHAIWNGERGAAVLTAEVDPNSALLVQRLLELIAQAARPTSEEAG